MLRQPLLNVKSLSTSVTTNTTFLNVFPSTDITGAVFKLQVSAFTGTSPTLDVYLQTSDDGGTTFYDCIHWAQITTTITNAAARWATVPVDVGNAVFVGNASDATIAAGVISGLPLLSNTFRIKLVFGGTIGTSTIQIDCYSNSMSSR